MALAEMANILVMSMNLMQSVGAKDAINEDATVDLTLWRCQAINDAHSDSWWRRSPSDDLAHTLTNWCMLHMVNDISLQYLDDMVTLMAHMMTWKMKELEITWWHMMIKYTTSGDLT